jgi:hypothetical protein
MSEYLRRAEFRLLPAPLKFGIAQMRFDGFVLRWVECRKDACRIITGIERFTHVMMVASHRRAPSAREY